MVRSGEWTRQCTNARGGARARGGAPRGVRHERAAARQARARGRPRHSPPTAGRPSKGCARRGSCGAPEHRGAPAARRSGEVSKMRPARAMGFQRPASDGSAPRARAPHRHPPSNAEPRPRAILLSCIQKQRCFKTIALIYSPVAGLDGAALLQHDAERLLGLDHAPQRRRALLAAPRLEGRGGRRGEDAPVQNEVSFR